MNSGLLWYDDSPDRDLAAKVRRAAAAYRRKHGMEPDVCFVHPTMFGEPGEARAAGSVCVGGVEVGPLPTVLVHHLWIGEKDDGKEEGKC